MVVALAVVSLALSIRAISVSGSTPSGDQERWTEQQQQPTQPEDLSDIRRAFAPTTTDPEVAQAQERFSAGVAGNADVITALLALTTSRAQLIDAETSLRYSQVSLARAEGRISEIH